MAIYKYTKLEQLKRKHKWLGSTIFLLKILFPILVVLAIFNWFFNTYILEFTSPVVIKMRSEQFHKEVEFYREYGPYLDEDYQEVIITPTDRPEPTPEPEPTLAPGLYLEPLKSFNVPDDIKEMVMIFSERANVPPAFAMGILLTENRSFNYYAVNTNYDGSQDHGLWQLNNIPEYDPIANTERAADILNSKRTQLVAMGVPDPSLGLLAESYNKGAAGALSLLYDPAGYARIVLENATLQHINDPFVSNPFAYVQGL